MGLLVCWLLGEYVVTSSTLFSVAAFRRALGSRLFGVLFQPPSGELIFEYVDAAVVDVVLATDVIVVVVLYVAIVVVVVVGLFVVVVVVVLVVEAAVVDEVGSVVVIGVVLAM